MEGKNVCSERDEGNPLIRNLFLTPTGLLFLDRIQARKATKNITACTNSKVILSALQGRMRHGYKSPHLHCNRHHKPLGALRRRRVLETFHRANSSTQPKDQYPTFRKALLPHQFQRKEYGGQNRHHQLHLLLFTILQKETLDQQSSCLYQTMWLGRSSEELDRQYQSCKMSLKQE
jgi:hypothetical protein